MSRAGNANRAHGEGLASILEVVQRYWGFDTLRPLQEPAIQAGIEQRDSLVVLPTGGGKSLCYQVPPILTERTDVVVSPLISLMKDQVDGLRTCGYPAAALHSGMDPQERRQAYSLLRSGECRLLLVSPERLLAPAFRDLIQGLDIRAFAIDEAHCISHWGHDFRPEYRQLSVLKAEFAGASVHAYTATATERVRHDIVEQLGLVDPTVLVGRFDRPNLIYRIVPRQNLRAQVREVLERHRGEAVIIYCLTRNDTERLASHLKEGGYSAACYHAGMSTEERRRIQDEFGNEQIEIIVATVAFGMGIDRSDVRSVIHAAMPKSVEHYQQETGRSGRDGLEAECILFHSPADALRWQGLVEKSAQEAENPAEVIAAGLELLQHMRRICAPGRCRHRSLTEYFGQDYGPETEGGCQACDVCLEECEALEDGTIAAQMILSCVARVQERFGLTHVVDVLRGAGTDRIRSLGHEQLSTYGLLKDTPKNVVTQKVYQLIDQELLQRTDGEYPILRLNAASWEVLRGQHKVWLIPIRERKVKKTAIERKSWEGVDRELFQSLRKLRTRLARERSVPPYVIFSDASLRDMAARRPRSDVEFLQVHGVGEKRLADFGGLFLTEINSHPHETDRETNG